MVEYPDRPCPVCKAPMTGRQRTGCSGKCRAEAARRRRKGEALTAVGRIEQAVRTLRLIWGEEDRGG